MTWRLIATILLGLILAGSVASSLLPGVSYSEQYREFTNAPPSKQFPLGTDDLGRNRLARLLCATRISLLLAAAAAIGTVALGFVAGGTAGYFGGWCDRCLVKVIDLMLALPWFFLLLAARALLPLNASPEASLVMTYGLLALLGWASPARVVRAGVRKLRDSEFVLQARAEGSSEVRVVLRQILPNLKPLLAAQFFTAVPSFILAETNLGFLGLSGGEPFPTWGNLLRDLSNPLALRPEAFAPVALVAISVLCLKSLAPWRVSQI